MIGPDKTRIMITLSKELEQKVSSYADAMGLTKGQFIVSIVGQHILTLDKSMGLIDKLGADILQATKELAKEQKVNE